MKYDSSQIGFLNIVQLNGALNEFMSIVGNMHLNFMDVAYLMRQFDHDGSGNINFWEFRYMLKVLGGHKHYERNWFLQRRVVWRGRNFHVHFKNHAHYINRFVPVNFGHGYGHGHGHINVIVPPMGHNHGHHLGHGHGHGHNLGHGHGHGHKGHGHGHKHH
jgi:hypothetical protein